jgi:hypothetical protein
MWGYSGGSIPTQFAAQLQPHCAPDLSDSLLGTTAGGIIANLSATLLRIDNTGFAGLGLGGLKGFSQEYPAVAKYVKDHLVSDKAEAFLQAGTLCLEPLENKYSNVGIFSFLDNGHDILYEESLKQTSNKNIMGQEAPTIPSFCTIPSGMRSLPSKTLTNWSRNTVIMEGVYSTTKTSSLNMRPWP